MRRPTENIQMFKERRQKVSTALNGAALVVASHPEMIRNHDVSFPYRQDSNLYYLTGFEEPESILILRPGKETVMFVRERDKERETWDGFRFGPEGVQQNFGIDQVFSIKDFLKKAPDLLKGFDSVYYRMQKNPKMDAMMAEVLETLRRSQGRTGLGLLTVHDADVFLGEFRLIKSDADLHNLRKACEISAQAHIEAMKFTRPGVNERDIHAVLAYNFLKKGSAREGYNYIVATGNNATTLHYNFNDQVCGPKDLMLIDAGAEYNYFTGDITRTFPVCGKFTEEQALVYEGVLKVQKEILDYLKPGVVFADLHQMGTSLLTDLMLELGFFNGRKQDIIDAQLHKRYYPHGIGHWLGMDVHDAGLYVKNNQSRPLEENMCFTVEPGLYIPADDEAAPAKFRGIGVRIEDNVRITRQGHENMTVLAPKEISDLEKIVGSGF